MCRIRRKRRWGADHIAHEVGLATSTVQNILNAAGEGRLDRGDRATDREPIHRYERDLPGELIHVDIKKIAAIPDGGGWRVRGRGYRREKSSEARRVGYRYIHTALDDRSRITYSEILDDEEGKTAAGFWLRSARWFQAIGITPQRVITDNGGCYKSRAWHEACNKTRTKVKKTQPYRPQTNGKVERFHRILLENGPTSGPGDQRPNEPTPMSGSSTSTITTDPTDRSNGQPPSASSRTTSPKSTPR